jgi:hypothetical protein
MDSNIRSAKTGTAAGNQQTSSPEQESRGTSLAGLLFQRLGYRIAELTIQVSRHPRRLLSDRETSEKRSESMGVSEYLDASVRLFKGLRPLRADVSGASGWDRASKEVRGLGYLGCPLGAVHLTGGTR